MFCFAKFCCLCLTQDTTLKDFRSFDENNIVYIDKIIVLFPALKKIQDDYFPNWLCPNCENEINRFYIFHQQCVKNYQLLEKYANQLNATNDHQNITKFIKCENASADMNDYYINTTNSVTNFIKLNKNELSTTNGNENITKFIKSENITLYLDDFYVNTTFTAENFTNLNNLNENIRTDDILRIKTEPIDVVDNTTNILNENITNIKTEPFNSFDDGILSNPENVTEQFEAVNFESSVNNTNITDENNCNLENSASVSSETEIINSNLCTIIPETIENVENLQENENLKTIITKKIVSILDTNLKSVFNKNKNIITTINNKKNNLTFEINEIPKNSETTVQKNHLENRISTESIQKIITELGKRKKCVKSSSKSLRNTQKNKSLNLNYNFRCRNQKSRNNKIYLDDSDKNLDNNLEVRRKKIKLNVPPIRSKSGSDYYISDNSDKKITINEVFTILNKYCANLESSEFSLPKEINATSSQILSISNEEILVNQQNLQTQTFSNTSKHIETVNKIAEIEENIICNEETETILTVENTASIVTDEEHSKNQSNNEETVISSLQYNSDSVHFISDSDASETDNNDSERNSNYKENKGKIMEEISKYQNADSNIIVLPRVLPQALPKDKLDDKNNIAWLTINKIFAVQETSPDNSQISSNSYEQTTDFFAENKYSREQPDTWKCPNVETNIKNEEIVETVADSSSISRISCNSNEEIIETFTEHKYLREQSDIWKSLNVETNIKNEEIEGNEDDSSVISIQAILRNAIYLPADKREKTHTANEEMEENVDDSSVISIQTILRNASFVPRYVSADKPKKTQTAKEDFQVTQIPNSTFVECLRIQSVDKESNCKAINYPHSSNLSDSSDAENDEVFERCSAYIYRCKVCDNRYRSEELLKKHVTEKHTKLEEVRVKCPYCPLKKKELQRILDHIRQTHGNVDPICVFCGEIFEDTKELFIHIRIHFGQTIAHCLECKKVFLFRNKMYEHMKTEHNVAKFKCMFCTKEKHDMSRILKHIFAKHTMSSTEVSKMCKYCGKMFQTNVQVREHIETTHDTEKVLCQYCGIQLRKFSYGNHMKKCEKHPSFRLHYKCQICKKMLKNKYTLKNHLLSHNESLKKFDCNICGMKFHLKGVLENHLRTHTGAKPFKCHICERCFAQRSSLINHTRAHSQEKPFMCKICGTKYAQTYVYKCHMRDKHGKNLFNNVFKSGEKKSNAYTAGESDSNTNTAGENVSNVK